MKKKVVILGGGVSSLGAAWKLADKGIKVEIIESKDIVGGLAATVKRQDYLLDYGPHYFLSERPEIVKKVTGLYKKKYHKDMPTQHRNVKLLFKNRFLDYPLNIKNILFEIPIYESFLIAASYFLRQFIEKIKRIFSKEKPDANFEEWAKKNFGDYLFKIFFKPYTEQFWGIKCDKLAPRTLPTNTRLSFFKALKLIFHRKVTKKDASLAEREMTLLLRYPPKGIGMVANIMADKVRKSGGKIHLGCNVNEIKTNADKTYKVTTTRKGKKKNFNADFVISTIPLNYMVKTLKPRPPKNVIESSKKLDFLSLIVIYIVIPKRNVLQSSYLYLVGTPFNRVSEINKFSPELCPEDENMLAVEISCNQHQKVWNYNEKQIFELCMKALEKHKIISRKEVKRTFMLKARNAYPIFFSDHEKHLSSLLNYVKAMDNFEVTGRSGSYLYVDIDQCIQNSFELVDKILPKLK